MMRSWETIETSLNNNEMCTQDKTSAFTAVVHAYMCNTNLTTLITIST